MGQAGKSDSYDEELARIDASIAELKIRDMAAAKERTTIAAKIQAAQFQRDILAHANQQSKAKKAAKSRRVRRKPAEEFAPPPPPSGHRGETPPPAPSGHRGEAPPPPPGARPSGAPPPPGATPMTEAPPPPPGARPAGPPPTMTTGSPTTGSASAGSGPTGAAATGSATGNSATGSSATTGSGTTGSGTTGSGTTGRRRGGGTGPRPEWAPPGSPHTGPPGVATDGVTALVDDPPPTERVAPPPRRAGFTGGEQHPPEASTQSVQNILLALGALLIGVAAVVFAGVAVSSPLARALILAIFTAIALVAAPGIAQRGLSSTAETIAAVGLALLPMTLYVLHGTSLADGPRVSLQIYLGVTFAITSVAAFLYATATRLSAPRYATVVALQPVPLLLAYPSIESPAGWGMALTVVAVLDLLLLTTVIRSGRLVPQWPIGRPVGADRETLAAADAGAADYLRRGDPADPGSYSADAPPRPESLPEEPDLIISGMTGPRRRWLRTRIFPGPRPAGAPPAGSVPLAPPATPPSADWLRELTFALLCVASAGALLYSSVALLQARAVPDAMRSSLVLVLAALVAVAAAGLLDNLPARNITGGVLTLAVIGSAARTADVVDPRWTLVVAAATVAVAGAVVGLLPQPVRVGPEIASACALVILGVFLTIDGLRAALAPLSAARPIWHADTAAYAQKIADAAGPSGWLLALSALLLTIAAALALPRNWRHEGAVIGVALTALAVPASLGLRWSEAPWPLVLAAIAIGGAGLAAGTKRIAVTHVAAAGTVGLFGAGAALSASWLTAAVLTALAGAGVMIAVAARQIPIRLYAWLVGDWASGAAALALPGAVVTGALAVSDKGAGPPPTEAVTVPALAVGFLAVAATLSYAAVFQVARREISVPLTAGAGLGAVALALAALLAPGATAPDIWVGALLLIAAGLLFFAKSIDNGRRSDRVLDGPDIAAAAATVAICGALARVFALAFPEAPLAVAGVVVLIVALGVAALPDDWRRGPVRGLALAGVVVGAIAGWQALAGGVKIIALHGPVWAGDLTQYPTTAPAGAWQAPFALIVVAIAAAFAAPRPWSYAISATAGALAAIGTPFAIGLPWWSPLLVGGAVGVAYAMAAVAATDPRAALSRAVAAAAVLLHAAGAGLARPWSTGAALLIIAAIGALTAVMARTPVAYTVAPEDAPLDSGGFWSPVVTEADLARDDTGMPRHRAQIGGAATGAMLLALPGVFAALAAAQDYGAESSGAQVVLTAALAASSLSLALLALIARWIPQYLPWATVGLVLGATITAFASIPTDYSTALYAAAAALLGVLAELLRGAIPAPGLTVARSRSWSGSRYAARWTSLRPSGLSNRWLVDPATSAVVLALVPTLLAIFSITPALRAALVDPLQQMRHIWDGPIPALSQPASGYVDATSVLAIVLLTGAAALAAIGFGGKTSEAVPVILPGVAITILIAPIALHAPFPAATTAGLVVFTIAMLGLALTPPPAGGRAGLLRTTRTIVFVIGLLAGNAGLAGSLARQDLTLFTLGSAVGVGLVAALAGRTQTARILGWLFAAVMAQLFVLAAAIAGGVTREWAAFGVLGVGAGLLIIEATVPRLGLPQYRAEATTVEWAGYTSAVLAGALAFDSPAHLAALLAAWGAVLGLAASRTGRSPSQRRLLFWLAVGFEIVGWWLFIALADVALPEAYTLPFAALALAVGVVESRTRTDLSSWAAYGPALLAAFVPTIGIVLAGNGGDLREVLLLLAAVATLIVGSTYRQQAPVVVGAVATAITAIHFAVTLVGPWLVLLPLGIVLLIFGATNENRRRTREGLRDALVKMR
ncbi:SCO7613 C-terminal domain-containing membrane protein [Paractinoplanes rhizophilus]|uniref:SCO7613 C-terminal domain-containing membrane protein n=1 Tax=Paractinoplanes rhizophilus TaxID=1416877 RepID=A0ABW2HUR0_9ACTN